MTSEPEYNRWLHRYCADVANELETRWQTCWATDDVALMVGNPGDDWF